MFSDDLQEMILRGLRESFDENLRDHDETVTRIEKRIKLIKRWMRDSYTDKLNGTIPEEEWKENNDLWREERDDLIQELAKLERDDVELRSPFV